MDNILTLNPVPSLKIKLRFNSKIFGAMLFSLIISLLFFYVVSISSLAGDYYSLKNYQKRTVVLEKENEFLEVNFSRSNSLNNIGNYLSDNYEKITSVKYIQIYPPIAEKSALNYEKLAD